MDARASDFSKAENAEPKSRTEQENVPHMLQPLNVFLRLVDRSKSCGEHV
jgi:hypothetical protein